MVIKKQPATDVELKQIVLLDRHLRHGPRIDHENPVTAMIRNGHMLNAGQKSDRLSKVASYLQEEDK
jgi:hypothetical protein